MAFGKQIFYQDFHSAGSGNNRYFAEDINEMIMGAQGNYVQSGCDITVDTQTDLTSAGDHLDVAVGVAHVNGALRTIANTKIDLSAAFNALSAGEARFILIYINSSGTITTSSGDITTDGNQLPEVSSTGWTPVDTTPLAWIYLRESDSTLTVDQIYDDIIYEPGGISLADNKKISLGDPTASASIYFDGTNFIFDSQETGSGDFKFNSGKVGIGVTPASLLHIKSLDANATLQIEGNGTNKWAEVKFVPTGAGVSFMTYSTTSGNDLEFFSAKTGVNTTVVTFDADGNVGIGITPTVPLHVSGNGLITGDFSILGNYLANDNTTNILFSGGNASNVGANLGMFGGAHATLADDIRFRASATTVLYYDHSATNWQFTGNVGIGGAPLSKFHVTGDSTNVVARFTSTDNFAAIAFLDDTTTDQNTVNIGADGDGMLIKTGGLLSFRIDSSGQVGIGKTPSVALDVLGSFTLDGGAGAEEISFDSTTTSGGVGEITFVGHNTSASDLTYGRIETTIVNAAAGSEESVMDIWAATVGVTRIVAKITTLGVLPGTTNVFDLGSGSLEWQDIFLINAPTVSSSRDIKDNFADIINPCNILSQLNGQYFTRNDDEAQIRRSGVIMEDVVNVFPEAITYRDGKAIGVKYEAFIPLLIEGYKEMYLEIQKLKVAM